MTMTDAWIRRNWPGIAAIAVLAVLSLVHQLWFRPTALRYARAVKAATDLGMPLDPNNMPRIMPPRLFARIVDSSLPAARAQEAANSGQLTAEFLGDLSQMMSRRGLSVVGTEPVPTTVGEHSIQLRAHVRARGRYSDFVLLLDDLTRESRLYGVDHFNLNPDATGMVNIDLWVSRLVLKSAAAT